MLPLRLVLENFTCHTHSDIDFTQFNSAVIVGRVENNIRRSNAVGKSKIFTAINYALYNQTSFSNIENIIRDGADKCKVAFTFMMGTETYRIERSRGRKSNSADLRLFKKNNETWDDLTERTSSGTEKSLLDIIKINYKTFTNSVHFAQNDLSGLALLTATARKELLKEALSLHIYSNLEKITKKRVSTLQQDLLKTNAVISSLEGLDAKAVELQEQKKSLEVELVKLTASLEDFTALKLLAESEFALTSDALSTAESAAKSAIQKESQLQAFLNSLLTKRDETKKRLVTISSAVKTKISEIEDLKVVVEETKCDDVEAKLNEELESQVKLLSDCNSEVKVKQNTVNELNQPIPAGPVCDSCKQNVSDDHRQVCLKKMNDQIGLLRDQIASLKDTAAKASSNVANLKSEISVLRAKKQKHTIANSSLLSKEKDIDVLQGQFDQYKLEFDNLKLEIKSKESELLLAKEEKANFDLDKINELRIQNQLAKSKLAEANQTIKNAESLCSQNSTKIAVVEHQITKNNESKEQFEALTKKVAECNESLNIHNLVGQAFGSRGIPSLIIHNMLDDLQINANEIIAKIKPGLQLEFEIDKENSKGEQTDTLGIKYLFHGKEREYDQLSGSQKLVVTLSLRLALSLVIQKSFGIEIKFLMLDEVDPSLDDEGLDSFVDMLRVIEKDFKVLLITHNSSLKDRFTHAVLVEQNEHMESTAKLVTSW